MKRTRWLALLILAGCAPDPSAPAERGPVPLLPASHPPVEGPAAAPAPGRHPGPIEWATWTGGRTEQGPSSGGASSSEPSAADGGETPVPVSMEQQGSVPLLPAPEEVQPTRGRKRMDIDQLSAAIRAVTGGIGWTEVVSGKEVDMFVQLAATLGKPDYLTATQEDLSPSTLFEKFLGDAARSVCQRLMEVDGARPQGERVFFIHASPEQTSAAAPAEVVDNLRALLVRWHGRSYQATDTQLVPWQWLLDSTVHITGDPVAGWNAVCVGLMTHPDFYSY